MKEPGTAFDAQLVINPLDSSPLLAVSTVTVHPSTASVPVTVLLYDGPLLCGLMWRLKGSAIQRRIMA